MNRALCQRDGDVGIGFRETRWNLAYERDKIERFNWDFAVLT